MNPPPILIDFLFFVGTAALGLVLLNTVWPVDHNTWYDAVLFGAGWFMRSIAPTRKPEEGEKE